MIEFGYISKCDGRGCSEEIEIADRFYEGMCIPNYLVPEGWNSVSLNNGRKLLYCPKHLVSVEVEERKGMKSD